MASFGHTVNPDQATFLGFGLEGVAYGVNAILFGVAMTVLIRHTPTDRASRIPILALTCFMFSLGTVHYALNFNNVYNSLMVHPRPHIAAETHLLDGADTIFILSDFASQLILIFRCYLVWGKTVWVIILPLLIACASVSCGLSVVGLVLKTSPTASQAPAAIVPIGTASFALSLCLNFIVSSLIVGRIWWMTRESHLRSDDPRSKTTVSQAMAIVVESGLLFLAAQFVFVILFAIAHPAQAVVEPMAVQIYGISPMLIIVRVGMGISYEQTTKAPISSVRFPNFTRQVETGTSMNDTGRSEVSTHNFELSKYIGDSRGTLTETGKDHIV
ncbi:hypothetical protein DFH07DRAFT_911796 [Mycena maculata]|uniref:Uncharacterized protein n=1 Tax=Mycena maculata TaxID=230809 RepID=A0AAD7K2E5_9AGAR|nr:hypothetical protein DFH07DRAFT_911796 [Mycena maculata]